jgi:phosphoglycerol transferase MdoB-like AlkP superfamily enzyme
MESFSGEFVGTLGHDFNITPEFDALTQKGVLFDRFFSNGTHTHQGMFATAACFPNLPGHEYLMQEPLGQHLFSGLASLLKPRGFQDLYVYNGDFSWDNQEGFFRNQGMTQFIGRDDHQNPVFIDPTWGVSDQDMFDSALSHLNKMTDQAPFFAILQTLSNHTPFALPDPLPIEKVTGFGELNEHLTAQKYSDWALGQFMKKAAKEAWYQDTLFVILGDHGFGIQRQLTEIDLLRFHVPLLMISPRIQQQFGTHNHHISSQVDVVPTAVSLLGQSFKHQCWGRDVFSLDKNDAGFAIIKPSGSDQTVALIKDDLILIKPPQNKVILKRFQLYPQQMEETIDHPELTIQMTNELLSFIETALLALKQDTTAVK